MEGRIGARHDRLRAQGIERPLLAGLGPQHADDVLLEV
jgi:hypothetical protein